MFTKSGFAALSLLTFVSSGSAYAQTFDRDVVVNNETSENMVGLFASRVGIGIWQENMLHENYVPPNHEIIADFDDGSRGHRNCYYDLRAVFDNGDTVTRWDVNVCSITNWTIHED